MPPSVLRFSEKLTVDQFQAISDRFLSLFSLAAILCCSFQFPIFVCAKLRKSVQKYTRFTFLSFLVGIYVFNSPTMAVPHQR